MKTAQSKCQIDSVAIGELHFVTIGTQVPLTAKYALRASSSGTSFGSGTVSTWSETTNKKLKELLDSMEEDLLKAIFEEGPLAPESEQPQVPNEDEVPEL